MKDGKLKVNPKEKKARRMVNFKVNFLEIKIIFCYNF